MPNLIVPTDTTAVTVAVDDLILVFDQSASYAAKDATALAISICWINDSTTTTTNLWSADKINTFVTAGYQPLDADLTALAALSGTNNIYYRSAANTWTTVTIGTGLSFSWGTLTNTVTATSSIVWITGTMAQFDTACTDGNFAYASDLASYLTTAAAAAAYQPLDSDLTARAGKTVPSGTAVWTSDTQTLTNKRITRRVTTLASAATLTPDGDLSDQVIVTALATNATIAAPTGTPTDWQRLVLRLKDNGTARTLTWNSIYRAVWVTLPSTTVISKTVYLWFIYNLTDTKWDCVAVSQEA